MTQTVVHVPASEGGGAFDPTDIEITDNTSGAFLIKEGSNEYMRINTTNGSEQMVLKGRPGSAANAQLFLHDQPFLQGNRSNFIQMSSSGVTLQSGTSGARIDNIISNSGNNFRILGTSSLVNFLMMDDSNATFTLNDSNSALFKIQDDAGSPLEFFKIDTTSGARDIRMKTGAGNQIFTMQEGSGTGKFFQIRNGAYNQIYMQDDNLFGILAERLTHTMYAGGFHKVVDASSAEIFKIDEDSNFTYTLDDASTAVFKVVDSNSSPRTYLTITEAGATEFGNAVGTNTIRGSSITSRSGNVVFRNQNNSQQAAFNNDFFIQNGGGGYKGQSVFGTPVTTTSTGTVTVASQTLKAARTFFYDSSGSGTATITVQYKTDGTFYEDGTSIAERHVTIHNKDSTHNVTYKFEPMTNEGTDFPALGSTDTVADDLVDGTGVTLTPGQTAIFKVITYAINSTHSNHKHYWTTIAKG